MGYQTDAIKGVSWITLLRVATRLLTFVRLAILGRLLTPAQFGAFGVASLVLSFLEIITETGINVFLVQEKSHIKEYINSAWVVSILRGILLALLILLLTPLIVTFFNIPDAYMVISLMALVPFIRGFINPAIVIYQKDLLFDKEFKLRAFLFCIDVTFSIVVGLITKTAIAFVSGLIASAVVEVLCSYLLFSLWPKFKVELHKVKKVIQRGWWVTQTMIYLYFADNGDNIVVGKFLGSGALGIYQVAYKFSTLPISEITNVVNQVVFPVFVRFADDKKRLWRAFIKVSFVSSSLAFALGILIYLFAEMIIIFFMGEQWREAIPVIQVLAVYGVLRTIFGNFSPLFLALGKQEYNATMTLARLIGLALFVVPLVIHFGMVGAGYAMLISMIFEIPIIFYFARKVFTN